MTKRTIQIRREELNISQIELARMADISPQYVCDIEHGRHKASFETAKKIAHVLYGNYTLQEIENIINA